MNPTEPMSNPIQPIRVGDIGNYYGGLNVFEQDGKFYWYVENYDTDTEDFSMEDAEEIPEHLFQELKKLATS